jgi:hypothetical protein
VSTKFVGGGWMVLGQSDSYAYFMQLTH